MEFITYPKTVLNRNELGDRQMGADVSSLVGGITKRMRFVQGPLKKENRGFGVDAVPNSRMLLRCVEPIIMQTGDTHETESKSERGECSDGFIAG